MERGGKGGCCPCSIFSVIFFCSSGDLEGTQQSVSGLFLLLRPGSSAVLWLGGCLSFVALFHFSSFMYGGWVCRMVHLGGVRQGVVAALPLLSDVSLLFLFGIFVWLILSYFMFSSSAFCGAYFVLFLLVFSSSAFLWGLFCLIFTYCFSSSAFLCGFSCLIFPYFFHLRHFCVAYFVLFFLIFLGISVWLILSYLSLIFSSAFLCGLFCHNFSLFFPSSVFLCGLLCVIFPYFSPLGISVWLILSYLSLLFPLEHFLRRLICLIFPYFFLSAFLWGSGRADVAFLLVGRAVGHNLLG